ncbi:MAG: hypothetical protein ACRC35_04880 [Angustibacter sp.]
MTWLARTQPDPQSVTPGILGFLIVFALAVATWLLLRNLTARLRRMRFREEARLAAQAESADRGAEGSEAAESSDTPSNPPDER